MSLPPNNLARRPPGNALARPLPEPSAGTDLIRALFDAARTGDLSALQGLLADGLSANVHGLRGATPLHMAARFNQPQAVALLLSLHADPAAMDNKGSTALDRARAVPDSEDVVRQLETAGAMQRMQALAAVSTVDTTAELAEQTLVEEIR